MEKGEAIQYNILILIGKDKKYKVYINIYIYKYIDIFNKVLYEKMVASCAFLSANKIQGIITDYLFPYMCIIVLFFHHSQYDCGTIVQYLIYYFMLFIIV